MLVMRPGMTARGSFTCKPLAAGHPARHPRPVAARVTKVMKFTTPRFTPPDADRLAAKESFHCNNEREIITLGDCAR